MKFLLTILIALNAVTGFAQKKKVTKTDPAFLLEKNFLHVKKLYRDGEISDASMWSEISKIAFRVNELSADRRAQVLQTQSHLLMKNNYKITAAVFAAQALKATKNPTDKEYNRSWEILSEVSRVEPIHNLLELMATEIKLGEEGAPVFENNWFYFKGNAQVRAGETDQALKSYGRVKLTDRYFLPTRYQTAMILVDKNKVSEATGILKVVYDSASQKADKGINGELANHALLALGRISYEQKKFNEAIKYYREVTKDSPQYYDSLFEQGWAFFMAGYPNHALGAIYGAQSPFFNETFNPEATMLNAIIYYWMCRYDDSRTELAQFMDKHSETVEALGNFVGRKSLSDDTAYSLFENVITGVSSESLGIPRDVLIMASKQDNMLLVRSQYASVISEMQRMSTKGIFKSKQHITVPTDHLEKWASSLRNDLGRKYLAELKAIKNDYDRLYQQAQFLYVELLMSEKDQLLGKELHASTKITRVVSKENVKGWAQKTQSWGASDKDEFWWDEVGFYIYRLTPMCQAN